MFKKLIYLLNALVVFIPFPIIIATKYSKDIQLSDLFMPITLFVMLILGLVLRYVTISDSNYGEYQWGYYKFALGSMVSLTIIINSYFFSLINFNDFINSISIYIVIFSGVILMGDGIKEMIDSMINLKHIHPNRKKTKLLSIHFSYIFLSFFSFLVFNVFLAIMIKKLTSNETSTILWLIIVGLVLITINLTIIKIGKSIVEKLQVSS